MARRDHRFPAYGTVLIIITVLAVFDLLGGVFILLRGMPPSAETESELDAITPDAPAGEVEPQTESQSAPQSEPQIAEEPEPEAEPETAAEPETSSEAPEDTPEDTPDAPATVRIQAGDTLYDLALEYWDSHRLWPALYLRNADALSQPDVLRVGSSLSVGSAPQDQDELLRAHIVTYAAYRDAGLALIDRAGRGGGAHLRLRGQDLLVKGRWVLYAGLRIDPDITEHQSVRPEDATQVARYVERFGPPNP